MTKVVKMGMLDDSLKKEIVEQIVSEAKVAKNRFISPKKEMRQSIEQDAHYLSALGQYIELCKAEINKNVKLNNHYMASKIQVEMIEAVGKYQANEGLARDKAVHYDNVFLPMYEKQLEESNEKWGGLKNTVLELLENNKESDDKVLKIIQKEMDIYNESAEKGEEEFDCHTYKIMKRLYSKYEENLAK